LNSILLYGRRLRSIFIVLSVRQLVGLAKEEDGGVSMMVLLYKRRIYGKAGPPGASDDSSAAEAV